MTTTETVRERPILFSDPMVKAILEGQKSQTRRVVSTQPPSVAYKAEYVEDPLQYTGWQYRDGWAKYPIRCPYGERGDCLWVREAWQKSGLGWGNSLPVGRVHYRATDNGEWKPYWGGWKPSIHMPRWASRLTLHIESIRIERLNDISEADAKAEGCDGACPVGYIPAYLAAPFGYHFAQLWDSINGNRPGCSWADNPWVWAITFKPELIRSAPGDPAASAARPGGQQGRGEG